MSSTALGTAREMNIGRRLAGLGYRWCKVSRSGKAPEEEREQRIRADLIAFAPTDSFLPNLVVSVGGAGKRLGVAFAELRGVGLPVTFAPLVVMFKDRKTWYYSDPDSRHPTLVEAMEAMRDE